MSFSKFIESNQTELRDPKVTNEVLKTFRDFDNSLVTKIQAIQLFILIASLPTTSKTNFIHDFLKAKDLNEGQELIAKYIEVLSEKKISSHIYAYFFATLIKIKMKKYEHSLKYIDPNDFNINELEKYGLDKSFGLGTYLETNNEFTIKGAELKKSVLDRPIISVPTIVKEIKEPLGNDYKCLLLTLPREVTSLPVDFLKGNETITAIYLNDKIKTLPKGALLNTPKLRHILSDALETLEEESLSGTNIETTLIGASTIRTVGARAFSNNKNLKVVDLKRVNNLGRGAFLNCPNIESVNLRITPETIANNPRFFMLFSDNPSAISKLKEVSLFITEGIIPDNYFENMESLTSIKIQNDIKEIGANAFAGCKNLTTLEFNFTGTVLNDYLFAGAENITKIPALPNVKRIGKAALKGLDLGALSLNLEALEFLDDYALEDAVLPARLVIGKCEFGLTPFKGARGLETLKLDTALFKYEDANNNHLPYKLFASSLAEFNRISRKLKNLEVVGELVPSIFEGWENLESVILLSQTKVISRNAFADCKNLVRIEIRNKGVTFEENAFKNCSALEYFNYGGESGATVFNLDKTVSIKKGAFANVGHIKTLLLEVKGEIEESSFSGINQLENLAIKLNPQNKLAALYTPFSTDLSAFNSGFKKLESVSIAFNNETVPAGFFARLTNLKTIIIIGDVKEIGDSAFSDLPNLVTLDFNYTGTILNDYVFANLPALETIPRLSFIRRIGNGALTNLDLRESEIDFAQLEEIGEEAFKGCSLNPHLVLNTKNVKERAFLGVKGVTKLTLKDHPFYYENSLKKFLPYELFASDLASFNKDFKSLTELVLNTALFSYAFAGWENITKAEISGEVSLIPDYAFNKCSSLVSVLFTASDLKVNTYAFAECTSLTNFGSDSNSGMLDLSKAKEVGALAFSAVESIKKIRIGVSGEIAQAAFSAMWKLEVIEYRYNAQNKRNTFYELFAFDTESLKNYSSLTNVVVSFPLGTVPAAYFTNMQNLVRLTIKGEITSLGKDAFSGLTKLEELIINYRGTKLLEGVFKDTNSLKSLPSLVNVSEVHEDAFSLNNNILSLELGQLANAAFLKHFPKVSAIKYHGTVIDTSLFAALPKLETFEIVSPDVIIKEAAFAKNPRLSKIIGLEKAKEIGSLAFQDTALVEATLSSELTYLGLGIFSGVKTLKRLVMPALVPHVGALFDIEKTADNESVLYMVVPEPREFFVPKSLESVEINGGRLGASMFSNLACKVVVETNQTNIPPYCFYGVRNLNVTLTGSLLKISESAFKNSNLETFDFTNVESIYGEAFSNTKITSLTFGKKIHLIDRSAFKNTKINEVNISDNDTYKLVDGTLINKEANEIILILPSVPTTYEVPSLVKTVYSDTFESVPHLEVLLLNNVETLNENSFAPLVNLKSIVLPESLENVKGTVFGLHPLLRSINLELSNRSYFTKASLVALFSPSSPPNKDLHIRVRGSKLYSDLLSGLPNIEILNLEELEVKELPPLLFANTLIGELTLPSTLTKFDNAILRGHNIKMLSEGAGEHYLVKDRVLFIDDSLVYAFPSVSELPYLDTLKEIVPDALADAKNLTDINLDRAINYHNNLAYLYNLRTVTVKGEFALPLGELLPNSKATIRSLEYSGNVISTGMISDFAELHSVALKGVKIIEKEGFKNNLKLKNVTGTETVVEVEDSAFTNSGQIKALNFSEVLKQIDTSSFINTEVESFNVSNNEKYIMNDGFFIDRSIKKIILRSKSVPTVVTLKEPLLAVNSDAFSDLSLHKLIIEDVCEVLRGAFLGVTSLTHLVIKKAEKIEQEILDSNVKLSTLEVPFIGYNLANPENISYFFKEGKRNNSLKTVVVSEQTSFSGTFSNHKQLRKIHLEKVTEIAAQTFFGTSHLTTVYLPNKKATSKFEKNWNKVNKNIIFSKVMIKYNKRKD